MVDDQRDVFDRIFIVSCLKNVFTVKYVIPYTILLLLLLSLIFPVVVIVVVVVVVVRVYLHSI